MADFQVLWTETAKLDLTGIVEFIAEESGSATALEAIGRVQRRCRTLATLPERGRIVSPRRSETENRRLPATRRGRRR